MEQQICVISKQKLFKKTTETGNFNSEIDKQQRSWKGDLPHTRNIFQTRRYAINLNTLTPFSKKQTWQCRNNFSRITEFLLISKPWGFSLRIALFKCKRKSYCFIVWLECRCFSVISVFQWLITLVYSQVVFCWARCSIKLSWSLPKNLLHEITQNRENPIIPGHVTVLGLRTGVARAIIRQSKKVSFEKRMSNNWVL